MVFHKVLYWFSLEQFVISGYSKPYRLDRNQSGGVIIYIREDIPIKELRFLNMPENVEFLFSRNKLA